MFLELYEKIIGISEQQEFGDLFHVSYKNEGKKIRFSPRIPDTEETAGEEDEITPRVSLSHTIEGCLSSMAPPVDTDIYYVYKLVNEPKLYKPTKEQVPDVERTGEIWALTEAELVLIHKIRFTEPLGGLDTDYSKYEIIEG